MGSGGWLAVSGLWLVLIVGGSHTASGTDQR
jgi:hypothetical protein